MGYLTERLASLTGFLRREWQRILDADAREEWKAIAAERPPVSVPERPTAAGYPDHLLPGAGERELLSTAREMEEDDDWYSALELYLELIRRAETAADGTLDVTLFNRIGDLHRRLAAEWYLEGVDRYAERDLRRGAVALCEKALHLDPNHPHGLRRRAWLERTGDRWEGSNADRRGESTTTSATDVGEPEAGAVPREQLGAEPPGREDAPAGAAGPETAKPPEEPPDEPEREPSAEPSEPRERFRRIGEVYTPGWGSTTGDARDTETGGEAAEDPGAGRPDDPRHPGQDQLVRLTDAESGSGTDSASPTESLPSRVVVPPEEDDFEGKRRRRRWMAVGSVLMTGAALAAFLLTDGPERISWIGSEETSPQPAEAASTLTEDARFEARAESLSDAIAAFQERLRDFGLNRIGCEGLERGLDRVRFEFSRLAGIRAATGAALEPGPVERYRGLTDEVREVERAFDEAGCSAAP